MSKDDKKAEFTPADNVAANNVADETAATDGAAEARPAKSRLPLRQTVQTGPNAQFVDPDPNDNDGPGTGVAPQGTTPKQGTVPQAPSGAPQAQGFSAPNGFTRGS